MTLPVAVGFDLWETLITDTPVLARKQEELRFELMLEVLNREGRNCSRAVLETAYRQVWSECHELYWSRDRDIEARVQIDHLLRGLGKDPSLFEQNFLDDLEAAYCEPAGRILPALVPGAAEVLAGLKAHGLGVGLVSNTGRTPGTILRKVLEFHGVGALIDVMVFSNEHGECKPRPSIFEKLLSGLDARASEVVFVGDNIYADVYGAQSAGMKAVLFVPEVRGMAVAPPVQLDVAVEPDAVIHSLSELPAVLQRLFR